MATVHYLNVKNGDCSIIQHNTGRVTVIDVCNAGPDEPLLETVNRYLASREFGPTDFNQKRFPVNPIAYLREHGIREVFRYIQTHPDMDHMDGLAAFLETHSPVNFWDTDNKKAIPSSAWAASHYNERDWDAYARIRDGRPTESPRRLALLAGQRGQYWSHGEDGSAGGDGLQVLAPTAALVAEANKANQDYNDCSYVILYRSGRSRILFAGDSHDSTWRHILASYRADVSGVDLLIAPHHGRDSGRDYAFLDVVRPTLTFFGNAKSEHLAYGAWRTRGLSYVTNNQAGCLIVDVTPEGLSLYARHGHYARAQNPYTFYVDRLKAWYVCPVVAGLVP